MRPAKRERFDQVQAMMRANVTGRRAWADKPPCLLSGLVRCGKCGSPMCGWSRPRGGKVHRYCRCNGYQRRGKAYCPGTSVRAEVQEAAVAAKVKGIGGRAETPRREPSRRAGKQDRERRNASTA